MGWNSWNTFGAEINEKLVRETAEAIVKSGLKDAGYDYVIIDDVWLLKDRDKDGRLTPDPEKFPSGMKALSDYVHSLGLKFGMYSCAGTMTCAGFPASFENEYRDAETFAKWGIDYLKYDYCYKPEYYPGEILYRRMGMALANSGRDILFAACSWGSDKTAEWMRTANAHTWRSTGDIADSFASVKSIIQQQYAQLPYGGKGCYNDMDMLIVGMNGKGNVGLTGCTYEEYRLHFSAWALLASPLIIGCDIRNMDKQTKEILTNKELIKINQDRGGRQTYVLSKGRNDDVPVFARYLENGDVAVGMFNLYDETFKMNFTLDALGLPFSGNKTMEFTDLWTGEKIKPVNMGVSRDIKAHDCLVLRGRVKDKE